LTDVVLILTTAPAGDAGEQIARTLLAEGLAACVNIGAPMVSLYRWHGAVERDEERPLVIKSTRNHVESIRSRIGALHPYELPEFLVLDVDGGSDAYLDWVRAETRPTA
jgi:periplasmic divalent cation tolerance protein